MSSHTTKSRLVMLTVAGAVALSAYLLAQNANACDEKAGPRIQKPVKEEKYTRPSGQRVMLVESNSKKSTYTGYTNSQGVTRYKDSAGRTQRTCKTRNGHEVCE